MEIQLPQKINTQYEINKQEIQEVLRPKRTIKTDDKNKGTHIRPYISVGLCDNLILQNVLLSTCIDTLAEDTILNDIIITSQEEENITDSSTEKIRNFWENNQDELRKQIIDYYSYGFGASEIIFNTNKEPIQLCQIQADTIYIRKERYQDQDLYYCVQQINGVDNVKWRLSNRLDEYPPQDNSLGICLWFGGGRKSDFFDYPCWISCFNHVSASVTLDMLDIQKINNGNMISGILTIVRPPMPATMNDTEIDSLEEQMENKGNGLFTLELTSLNTDIPLKVDYIQISESNYDYLNQLSEKSDKKILATFKIPKARLLIDDTTESMNSNKTNTLYKIYSIELNNRQRPLENKFKEFNNIFFKFDGNVEIETPVFIDDKETEVQITLNLFNNGLITLGQAIKQITGLYAELNDDDTDYDNPIYNERYYNGQPLGLSEPTKEEKYVDKVGELIDYIQIS